MMPDALGARRRNRGDFGRCAVGGEPPADMVLNVDLPFTAIGWGSMHIADTVHIVPGGLGALTFTDVGILCRP